MKYLLLLLSAAAFPQAVINAPAVNLNTESTVAVLAWMGTQHARPATTVSPAVQTIDTAITVADAAGMGAGSVLVIESEHLLVTSRVGQVLTVTRGYNGTTIAPHANRTPIAEMKYRTLNNLGKAVVVEALQRIIEHQEFTAAQSAAAVAAKAKAQTGVQ